MNYVVGFFFFNGWGVRIVPETFPSLFHFHLTFHLLCAPAPDRIVMFVPFILFVLYPCFERISANRLIQEVQFSAASVPGFFCI